MGMVVPFVVVEHLSTICREETASPLRVSEERYPVGGEEKERNHKDSEDKDLVEFLVHWFSFRKYGLNQVVIFLTNAALEKFFFSRTALEIAKSIGALLFRM